jgi:hypothetical protein
MKAGGKQNNRLAESSDSIGNRRAQEDSKSIPISLRAGKNEPFSHTTERTNRREELDNQHGP